MLANEMFLDSAALRSSVVSHAKTLGYEVSSPRAPIATVNISLSTSGTTKTMPAGTAFTTSVDGTSYQFVTIADVTASNTGSAVPFDSVNIYEGSYVPTRYTVDVNDVDQKFLLSDARSDTTTLTVKVQNSTSDTTTTTYTRAKDITQLSTSSTVYYLQETDSVYLKFTLVTVQLVQHCLMVILLYYNMWLQIKLQQMVHHLFHHHHQ